MPCSLAPPCHALHSSYCAIVTALGPYRCRGRWGRLREWGTECEEMGRVSIAPARWGREERIPCVPIKGWLTCMSQWKTSVKVCISLVSSHRTSQPPCSTPLWVDEHGVVRCGAHECGGHMPHNVGEGDGPRWYNTISLEGWIAI